MVCFYIPPIALEIYISRRTTRDITNVLETMIKPWCLSHCRHVAKRDYLQFPYLQWNIEGKLFLLHTKRLNPNAKKFRTNLSCWIRFLTQTLLLTSYKSWKESNVHLLEIQTEKAQRDRLQDSQNDDQATWHLQVDWLVYYLTTTIFHFLPKLLFYFSFQNK